MKTRLQLQTLEQRQVPATLLNPTTLTYQDVDGDLVTVSLNKRILTTDNIASVFHFSGGSFGDNSAPQSLESIDLFALNVQGTAISLTAKNLSTGKPSTANVGSINASGFDLKSVVISGDLGKIQVGDSNLKTKALGSLTVGSLGVVGVSGGNDLHSEITGSIGKLTIRGNLTNAFMEVGGNLGTLTVAGSIEATTSGVRAASILVKGNITTAKVGKDMIGGTGEQSGAILAEGTTVEVTKTTTINDPDYGPSTYTTVVGYRQVGGNIGSITIGGSIIGGAIGSNIGSIQGIKVGGDLIGGEGNYSGSLFALSTTKMLEQGIDIPVKLGGNIGTIQIGGSVSGGGGFRSGSIIADIGNIRSVRITGDQIGSGGEQSGSVLANGSTKPLTTTRREIGESGSAYVETIITGYTLVGGTIGSVTVGGSVLGGSSPQSGVIGTLLGSIGQVKIGGSLIGGADDSGSVFAHSFTEMKTVGSGDSTVDVPIKLGGNLRTVNVGASVMGGNGARSGAIIADQGNIGTISIKGDLLGGSGEQAGSISAGGSSKPITKTRNWTVVTHDYGYTNVYHYSETTITNYQLVGGTIGSVTVGGSVIGGSSAKSGSIGSELGSIGSIRIKGNMIGGAGTSSGAFFALGTEQTTDSGKAIPLGGSIGSVTIDGDVSEGALVADRSIRTITIGKNWNSGNIVVGNETNLTSLPNSALKIGSILIRGAIGGDPPPTTGAYVFTAPTIGSLKVGKQAVKLLKGSANDSKDLTSLVKLIEFDAEVDAT